MIAPTLIAQILNGGKNRELYSLLSNAPLLY